MEVLSLLSLSSPFDRTAVTLRSVPEFSDSDTEHILHALGEEARRQFLIAGGYTPGKYVQMHNVAEMFTENIMTKTFGMRITSVYPSFSATSEFGFPNPLRYPQYRIHISPSRASASSFIPPFSLFYSFTHDTLRVSFCSRQLGNYLVNHFAPDLIPHAAQLLISSLGAWKALCQRYFAHIVILDVRDPTQYLPLTPQTPSKYNDSVADHIDNYQQIAKVYAIFPPQDTAVATARIALPQLPSDLPRPFAQPTQFVSSLNTVSTPFPYILEYSGPVLADPTPQLVDEIVRTLKR